MIKQGIALKSAVCQRCIVHRAPVVSQRVRTTQYDMKYSYPHFQVKKQDIAHCRGNVFVYSGCGPHPDGEAKLPQLPFTIPC